MCFSCPGFLTRHTLRHAFPLFLADGCACGSLLWPAVVKMKFLLSGISPPPVARDGSAVNSTLCASHCYFHLRCPAAVPGPAFLPSPASSAGSARLSHLCSCNTSAKAWCQVHACLFAILLCSILRRRSPLGWYTARHARKSVYRQPSLSLFHSVPVTSPV